MWELEFGVVEEARARRHGRSVVRREERVQSDEAVVLFANDGRELAKGFCLDRSANGARVILAGADGSAIGRYVAMSIGEDTFAFRVVWAYVQDNACVLGLARDLVLESGAFPVVAVADATLVSRAA